MNKFLLAVLLIIFPILALADGSLSLTPPASDFSVVFLGNIFGIVDGVLHGTGSQIMGSMFGVFNAAVLALGGVVIMYTLLVSTMNTAQEGQMLGQKWSSIWIPVRSVMGLALLVPKSASGYCLMQIFVMWIVVQGVGAADKVWDAALSYLNRGGVIVQAQVNPADALTEAPGGSEIAAGAQAILVGQVCMLGLQHLLESQLKNYQKQLSSNSGACYGTPSVAMQSFCKSTVPDFVASVSPVKQQALDPKAQVYIVPMPNIDSGPYQVLNGICGSLQWNPFPAQSLAAVKANISTISESDLDTASLSRVIAIQQMYTDLTSVAQAIVGNFPGFADENGSPSTTSSDFSSVAVQQFGVPHTASGPVCADSTTEKCVLWGGASQTTTPPLFNGTEFQNAIADYNGIMLPTLTLVQQAQKQSSANDSRQFISDASTEGWIMAGSYFFDLINLNVQANALGNLIDSNTGLDKSNNSLITDLVSAFGSGASAQCTGTYANLCVWLNQNAAIVVPVLGLLNGTGLPGISTPISPPALSKLHKVIDGPGSSTVYGYTNNATVLQLPGQPGMKPLQFANMIHISVDTTTYQLPSADFPCGNLKIMFWSTCLGSMFGDIFYNFIIRNVYNFLLDTFQTMINEVLMLFLLIPLQGMASIFKKGLDIISTPGTNPIVALAQMGTYYINFTVNLWLQLIEMSIVSALLPGFGLFIFALIGMSMPLLLSWLGIMVSIGFTTAYYVPILPYMIFTFGSIAWLMAVIEAMVAAPIVALGVTHPEGHDAFGKGEQAVMILMNVFLRPSMMIIGYIAAIAVSYVSVWIINAGFDHAIGFVQGSSEFSNDYGSVSTPSAGVITGGYSGWAGIYAYFFSILMYTMLYLTVVTKAFTLIAVLPDKVLRWIGGQAETAGSDASQWGEEAKGKVGEAGKETLAGQKAMDKKLVGGISDQLGQAKDSGGGSADASGGKKGGGEAAEAGMA